MTDTIEHNMNTCNIVDDAFLQTCGTHLSDSLAIFNKKFIWNCGYNLIKTTKMYIHCIKYIARQSEESLNIQARFMNKSALITSLKKFIYIRTKYWPQMDLFGSERMIQILNWSWFLIQIPPVTPGPWVQTPWFSYSLVMC